MGLLSTVRASEGARLGPQDPAGRKQSPSTRLRAELGPVGWSASQAQQLTRYIPVANLLFISDMR